MIEPEINPRAAESTQPEDAFVELFAQVFGFEKTQLLAPEYPVADIYGTTRYIDFALKSTGRMIAFEVDGPTHYAPPDFDLKKFEDDLLRQNSLIHQGWQVFRWSDRELAKAPDRVKEQLALFLERIPGLLELDDFLPRQTGASIDLRAHQRDALDWLEEIRREGKTIALLEHATGAGKTVTAISDAKRIGPRVLYVAHRKPLVEQTAREVRRLWPEVSHGKILGGTWQPERDTVCACDILNEGWDCPDVEVLLMARPTLSKIIYMQQLGRGTRKAPGKESLIVFDFVDNAGRYNQSWCLHRLTKTRTYRPGGLVLAPEDRIAEEDDRGQTPPTILNLGLWAESFEEIDIFDWQSVSKDMLSVADLELALAASEGYLRKKVQKGELTPNHALEIGTRPYYYFRNDRKAEIAEQFRLEPVTAANIRDRFFAFCGEMDMSASYKPVLLHCLLDTVDECGAVPISALALAFRDFYADRQATGQPVEKPRARMSRVADLSESEIQRLILEMPFRKFAQPGVPGLRAARLAGAVRTGFVE